MDDEHEADNKANVEDGLWPPYCDPNYVMPGVIEIKTTDDTGKDYYFPVQVVKAEAKKKYFGGYRNKKTNALFHHAASQTPTDASSKKIVDTSHLRTRDTQTYDMITRSQQGYRESGTQMDRVDLSIDVHDDVIIKPKAYFTAEDLMLLKRRKTLEIQRVWRGWMARNRAAEKRRFIREFGLKMQAETEAEAKMAGEIRKRDMERRARPQTNADFSALYNELDQWREEETKQIKASDLSSEEKRKALTDVLTNETKALQSIQKLKVHAIKDAKDLRTEKMLEAMAAPHQWQMSNGQAVAVDSPETERARALYELYQQLKAPVLSSGSTQDLNRSLDSRLEILLKCKWTVKENSSALTRDICDLVDREADLLKRGRAASSMTGLRNRLNRQFLLYIQDSENNPRAADFIAPLPVPPRFFAK
jgi:hypothetical protein